MFKVQITPYQSIPKSEMIFLQPQHVLLLINVEYNNNLMSLHYVWTPKIL